MSITDHLIVAIAASHRHLQHQFPPVWDSETIYKDEIYRLTGKLKRCNNSAMESTTSAIYWKNC